MSFPKGSFLALTKIKYSMLYKTICVDVTKLGKSPNSNHGLSPNTVILLCSSSGSIPLLQDLCKIENTKIIHQTYVLTYTLNSIQCTDCCEWVHKRCSGARCPLVTIQSFRCRICLTDEEVRCEGEAMESLSLENGEVLEGVRKFRYLGDMLNGEGGSRLASISRVGCGWKKFRELSGILTSKKVALRLKGKVYGACVRSSMIYGEVKHGQ